MGRAHRLAMRSAVHCRVRRIRTLASRRVMHKVLFGRRCWEPLIVKATPTRVNCASRRDVPSLSLLRMWWRLWTFAFLDVERVFVLAAVTLLTKVTTPGVDEVGFSTNTFDDSSSDHSAFPSSSRF